MSRKVLFLAVGVCVFLAAGSRIALSGAPDSTKTDAGQITFELKYRGLTGAKGEPRIQSFYGFGSSDEAPSAFTKSLNLPKGRTIYPEVRFQNLSGNAEWLALELDEKQPVALYMDMDGDGKLSRNERILPSKEKSPLGGDSTFFVTPDFTAKTKDGNGFPCRRFAVIGDGGTPGTGGNRIRYSPMVGTGCIWEGAGSIDGKSFNLALFDGNLDGQFTKYGQDTYALAPEAEYLKTLEKGEYLPRERLSSLVPIGQQFYSLRIETTADGVRPVRAVLRKSEIQLSKITFEFTGTEEMKAELGRVYLCGRGNDVFLNLNGKVGKEFEIPTGSYEVELGMLRYDSVNPPDGWHGWQVDFQHGSEITVAAATPCIVRLGRPKLIPTAVKEQDRYRPEEKPKTVFKKGDEIYCSPEIKGTAGEKYGRFCQPSGAKVLEPQVRIQDANGKEVVSASMQYG